MPDKTVICLKGNHSEVLRFVQDVESLVDWVRVSALPLASTPAAILVRDEDVDVLVELAAERDKYVGTLVLPDKGTMRERYFDE